MKWINYHHLLYFKSIAELGSIAKASAKLHIGQPTLSVQLKQFEDSLGVQLFERKHKKLILTEHGKLALQYAKTISNLGGEMYDALKDRHVPTKVNFQIGALDSIAKQVIFQLAGHAYKSGPSRITFIEGNFEDLLNKLRAHELDLVVTNYLPKDQTMKDFYFKPILRDQIRIYGAPEFAHLRKNFPDSLRTQPFVFPTYDSQLRFDIEHWLKQNLISVDVIAESQDIALKKLMAIEKLALIPSSETSVSRQLESGELIEIGSVDGAYEELFLVSVERKISNPIAEEIMRSFELST